MKIRILAIAIFMALFFTACSSNEALEADQRLAAEQLDRLNDTQPVPSFSWSQLRQTLIEITMAQAESTQTTSFFFNLGVTDPAHSCPSIGFPIPATAQLTNPEQATYVHSETVVLPQIEPTGIYSGTTTATNTLCVGGDGRAYTFYWEGFVGMATGPAEWDYDLKKIVMTGDSSFDFTTTNE